MQMSDPIADMLTRLRNAAMARHAAVAMPSSKMKEAIAAILVREGFVQNYEVMSDGVKKTLRVQLKYTPERTPVLTGLKRVSRPGRRVYFGREDVPEVLAGLGTSILTTSRGVMTGRNAVKAGVGGEVLCNIW